MLYLICWLTDFICWLTDFASMLFIFSATRALAEQEMGSIAIGCIDAIYFLAAAASKLI